MNPWPCSTWNISLKEAGDDRFELVNGLTWPSAFLGHDRVIKCLVAWPSGAIRNLRDGFFNDALG